MAAKLTMLELRLEIEALEGRIAELPPLDVKAALVARLAVRREELRLRAGLGGERVQ